MSSNLKSWSVWAYDHTDHEHPKYDTLAHSSIMTAKGTLLFVIISLFIRYNFYEESPYHLHWTAPYIGIFLLAYLVAMISTRYYENGCPAIYEFLWACNESMLLAAIGCLTGDSFLIRTTLVVVSVDQLLWYVDIIGYLIKRRFYVGVAKYIVWPETTKIRLATTFHHIWFLPLCLFVVHPTAKYTTFSPDIYILSCIFSLLLAIIGRISTPKQITIKKPGQEPKTIYMNLNLSWELWKDVKIGFLEKLYKILPPKALIFMLSFIWNIGNFPGFLLFWGIESLTQ